MKFQSTFMCFLLICIYSCEPQSNGNAYKEPNRSVDIEPNVEALDIRTNKLELLRINNERKRRIILVQTDTNNINDPIYFEQTDTYKMFGFRQYLDKKYIRKYSCGAVTPRDYTLWLGIGDRSCEYFVNTTWKSDSIIIVPTGYQGYIPMSKADWSTFIKNFRNVERKTYKVSNLLTARIAYKYITENNIAAQYQVDKYDDLWGKPNIEWLKYEGCFKFKDTIKYEDLYGNKTKIKLMSQYPQEKFSIEIYTSYADLNTKVYQNIVTVFCNQDFYEKFHSKTIVAKWKPIEVLMTVISDDKRLSSLDSIIVGRPN